MSLAAQTIPGRAVSQEIRVFNQSLTEKSYHEDLHLLGALFIALQIIDGLLTYHGVTLRGTGVEGNILIRILMESFGIATALVAAKLLAVVFTIIVCVAGVQISWVRPALISLIGLYALLAVVPWSYILIFS